jgi:hypothetical protein
MSNIKQRINVTLSAYEGSGFPNADEQFEQFVLATLVATYPDATIEVSTAQGSTRVFVDGEPNEELAQEIGSDWWEAFCASSSSDEVEHCAYCGAEVPACEVPEVGDDIAWTAQGEHHATNCEWIATRAHRRVKPAAQWVYVIANDLTPNRATVVAVYTSGDDANAHMARVGGFNHAMLVRPADQRPDVGERIWL